MMERSLDNVFFRRNAFVSRSLRSGSGQNIEQTETFP